MTPSDRVGVSEARGFRSGRWAIAFAMVLVVGAGAYYFLPRPESPPVDTLEDIPEPTITRVANPGYVGSQVCSECHAGRHAEYSKSRHATACVAPSDDRMPPGFKPGKGRYESRDPSVAFEMVRKGDGYFQSTIFRSPGSTERRIDERIDLVYGLAGTGDEVYFSWRGNRLVELPISWLHTDKCWAEGAAIPYGATDLSRVTPRRCLECHNTWIEHVPGTLNEYQRDGMILNVGCEKCHGPAKEHVDFHRANPKSERTRGILVPSNLSRDRQLDVCSQCHSNAYNSKGPGFSYRPGQPLENFFRTAKVAHREEDHVADQEKYLRKSACFKKSDAMTCTTCHDPHRPTDVAAVAKACFACHEREKCKEQPRLPAEVRGECVSCHMPRFTRIQVHFHKSDDVFVPVIRPVNHAVGIFSEGVKDTLHRYHRGQPGEEHKRKADALAKELTGHWRKQADAMVKNHRYLGAIGALREALRYDATEGSNKALLAVAETSFSIEKEMGAALKAMEQQRLGQAVEHFTAALKLKPDLGKAHGKLGSTYALMGRRAEAAEHWKQAAKFDPDEPYGWSMLGWTGYLESRIEDSLAAYEKAVEIEPYDATLRYHHGLALLKAKRWEEAATTLRKAAEISPLHAGASQALSHALGALGQHDEAVRQAHRAAKATKFGNADVLLTLADALAGAGRYAVARQQITRAFDVLPPEQASLSLQLRERLASWKGKADTPRPK